MKKTITVSEKKFLILDFDGTFYKTPVPQELEDAIDLSMFKLFTDKLKVKKNANEVLKKLDKEFEEFDRSEFTHEELIYFSDKTKPFSVYLEESKDDKDKLMITRALVKMIKPNGIGNHRVSSMLNLDLDISQSDIEDYYRKYATIDYKNIERNSLVEEVIYNAKRNGYLMFIYTDNSKENVMSGMKTLGYDSNDFELIIDMFDCNGGTTKKMDEGIDAFKKIMESYCEKNNIEYNLSNFMFYDDNLRICDSMASNGIQSFHVLPTEIKQVKTQHVKKVVTNMTLATQPLGPISLEPISLFTFSISLIIILLFHLIGLF